VAGHARYTALLDACVLHPMAMADSLMSLASSGLYAAKWSQKIESEWIASSDTD
jgi:hydrogenase/urease accessory protein HupE